jgi:uncharacterized protein YjbI with pentapeptide repeats
LNGVDFTEANASDIAFNNCTFHEAIFENTNLLKSDLSRAEGFNIDPEINKIKGARFSASNLSGLLYKYDLKIDS